MKLNKALLGGVFALGVLSSSGSVKTELRVYTWSDYFDASVLAQFERLHDCRVRIETFDSNEAMCAKLLAGSAGYDVITPSTYMIQAMIDKRLIQALDISKLPNVLKNIDKTYANCIFDPSFEYSVPYVVNYAGLAYRKDRLKEPPASWRIFEDVRYRGQMSILDDPRETIGIALLTLGHSVNSTSAAEIDKAVNLLLTWRANVAKFDNERYKSAVAGGEWAVGHGYFSDSIQIVMKDREHVGFVLPQEGFTISADEFVVAAGSSKADLAHAFINFMYSAESAKANMASICATMPVAPALAALEPALKEVLCLSSDTLKRGEVIRGFEGKPEARKLYGAAWKRVNGGK